MSVETSITIALGAWTLLGQSGGVFALAGAAVAAVADAMARASVAAMSRFTG
jgi:hypothetical protein